jgi:hypothetical protein
MTKTTQRDKYLQRVYGVSELWYNTLLKGQKNCCAVCGKHKSLEKKSLAVDHDHKTREIFGILCSFCNHKLIGRIRNPDLFAKAAGYLLKGTGYFVPVKKKKKRKRRK